MKPDSAPLFEEDYLRRTHSTIVGQPDIALTELVANCWDAGANLVEIILPNKIGGLIQISDDGVGMTEEEFYKYWRTLSYNRILHQGNEVRFPPGVEKKPRHAYGRNGVGRHAMFCFCDSYDVETSKDGVCNVFRVTKSAGQNPFEIAKIKDSGSSKHGTIIRGEATRSTPRAAEMLSILSARFLYDPEFVLTINGETLELDKHDGLIEVKKYNYYKTHEATLHVVDSGETAKTKFQHGIALWHDNRLVGSPSWSLGGNTILDGRTKEAKRLTFVVRLTGIGEEILSDWTGFRQSQLVEALYSSTEAAVREVLTDVFSKRVHERIREVVASRHDAMDNLGRAAKMEVQEFMQDIAITDPLVPTEVIGAAVDALIRLENSKSGQALIKKLLALDSEDITGLNRLLEDWTIKDALSVLDEIGKRIRIVEMIEKLCSDPAVDELHTLHPLITQARWLFGPDYDSNAYISNATLRTVMKKLTLGRADSSQLTIPKKRPDLLFLKDSSVSITGIEEFGEGELIGLTKILLVELKRGDSTIGKKEMRQAQDYVQEIMEAQEIEGKPLIRAFVVGHNVDSKGTTVVSLGEGEQATIVPCTYNRLVRSANKRLFNLREQISAVYPENVESGQALALGVKDGLF